MNILPKKSWHVRTKKNIERVRRDEAEAERLAKIEQDRVLQVEQEIRTKNFRIRAGITEPQSHFNLFEPSLVGSLATNRDHAEEKRREQDRWEEKIGISKRLVKSEDVNQPWYCQPKTTLGSSCDSYKRAKSDLIMSMYDPMTTIKHAEEIARAKKAKRKDQERIAKEKLLMYHQQYSDHPSTSSRAARCTQSDISKLESRIGHPDSSPECVGVVLGNKSSRVDSSQYKHKRQKCRKEKRRSHKSSHKHHRRRRDR